MVKQHNPSGDTSLRRHGLRDWGVRSRLLAAILLVALTTLTVGVIGLERMSVLSGTAQRVYREGTVPLNDVRALQAKWWEFQAYNARSAIPGLTSEVLAFEQKSSDAARKDLEAMTSTVAQANLGATARAAFATYQKAATTYLATLDRVVSGKLSTAEINKLVPQMQSAEASAVGALTAATNSEVAHTQDIAAAAKRSANAARTLTLVIVVAGLAISVLLALLVANSVIRPVRRIREVLERVAGGDLRVRVQDAGRDELAHVAGSLDTTLDGLAQVLELVGTSATQLAASSQELNSTAVAIAENTHDAASQAEAVSSSADDVSSSVDTLAQGSDQMAAAIREIAHNAAEAAQVASQAVGAAEATTRSVGRLGDSSQEIASVVKLITTIAEQTNLLALNATIEAARAGESGKGFAVVASEVKELAQETARATEDISSKVDAIQTAIAAAVEQQTATTNEMNRNVAGAAGSSRAIAGSITGLAASTQETTTRLSDAQRSAADLARMSTDLQEAVARFTV